MFRKTFNEYKYLIFSALLALTLFWPSFFVFFTNDDFFLLKIGKATSFNDVFHFFSLLKGPDGLGMYRPLTTQLFYSIAWIFNLTSFPLHLISFGFYILVLLIIRKLLLQIGFDNWISNVTVFLYSVASFHFAHFYYLATFQEIGMTLFALLSIYSFLLYEKHGNIRQLIFSIFFFTLALASKETAVVTPFLILLSNTYLTFKNNKKLKIKDILTKIIKSSYLLTFYFIILSIYFYFRLFHYGFATGDSYMWDFSLKIFNTIFWYFVWIFNIPETFLDFVGPGLKINPNLFKYWGHQSTLIVVGFAIEIGVFLFSFIRRFFSSKRLKENLLIGFFAFLWFVTSLLPVLFLPIHKFTFYLTLPSIGVLIYLAYLLSKSNRKFVSYLFFSSWLFTSFVSLSLTKDTHWITQGAKVAENFHKFMQNKNFPEGTNILFIDTSDDRVLPWSPTNLLKNVLSDNNYFEVFYEGKIKAFYDSSYTNKAEIVVSRQFLGY